MEAASTRALPPEIARIMADVQRTRFSPFAPVSLAWLALAPCWTEGLAAACKFPTGTMDLATFLRAAEQAGFCSRGTLPEARNPGAETARTLSDLWPFLSERQQNDYRERLLTGCEAVTNREESLQLRLTAAAKDKRGLLWFASLIENLGQIPDAESRARLLVHACSLRAGGEDLIRRAWESIAAVRAPVSRAALRLSLPPECPRIVGEDFSPTLLAEIRAVEEPAPHAMLLSRVAQLDPDPSLVLEAAAVAGRIEDPESRSLCFGILSAVRGASRLLATALQHADSIADPAARVRALVTIAGFCPEPGARADILGHAWSIALNIQDANESTRLLAPVAATMAAAGLPVPSDLPNPETQSEVLLAMAAALREKSSAATIEAARSAIRRVPLENLRRSLLIRLGAVAPSTVTAEALAAAQSLPGDSDRRTALLSLIPVLEAGDRTRMIKDVLLSIQRVADPVVCRSCFLQLAPFLDERQMSTVLEMATGSGADRSFTALDSARTEIFEYLKEREDVAFLQTQALQIGRSVSAATSFTVPAALARWSALASRVPARRGSLLLSFSLAPDSSDENAASYLTRQIRSLVDSGDTGSALEWLNDGKLLAAALGGDIEAAVLTGRHRVELAYRQAVDELHLRRYFDRPELAQAFIDLRDGPDSHWGLHYLGVGGVGKTMLLRHITSRLAVRNGRRLATTRVDFDHISPEFPVRKPGQLLAELADELRIYGGSSRLESRFAEFQDQLLALHASLESQQLAGSPLRNVLSRDFENVMEAFSEILQELPPPVIFILDTCEELAKLEPFGTSLPSVEATFYILEFLQHKVPTLRVVFAGRRLLARAGHCENGVCSWSTGDGELADRIRYLPERKDFLRLQLVRGFSRADSTEFLKRVAGARLDDPCRDAILDRSPEAGTPPPLVFAPPLAGDAEPRFNPFDLALYAEWLREDSSVNEKTIRGGNTDPWVEMRIIRRLESELLKQVLPAVVLLRRFNIEMLGPVLPPRCDRDALFRDLAGHEWTDLQRDEDLQLSFIEVNSNLLPRLEHYFEWPPQRADFEAAREQLAPALGDLVRASLEREQPFSRLSYSLLDATLRLLPTEQAVSLWRRIDELVTSRAEWHWALKVCPQLLGDEAPGTVQTLLRLQIRATLNAALLHLQRDFNPDTAWAPMLFIPDGDHSEIREGLSVRAAIFTALDGTQLYRALQRLKDLSGSLQPQAVAGFLARLSYLLDTSADHLDGFNFNDPYVWSFVIHPELARFYAVLRWRWRNHPPDNELRDRLSQNLPQPPQHWADWRVPDSLIDRLRLEFLRPESDLEPDFELLKAWRAQAVTRLDNIDSERLIARTLQLELAWKPADPDDLAAITEKAYYDATRVPEVPAHSETPPLFVELAEGWASIGEARQVDELNKKVRFAILRGRHVGTAELDNLGMRLAYRFRQLDDPKLAASTPAFDRYLAEKASGNRNPPAIRPREAAAGAMGLSCQRDQAGDVGIGFLTTAINLAEKGRAPLDAFFAATLLALSFIRLDHHTDATPVLEEMAGFYEEARGKHHLNWPPFEAIRRAEIPSEAQLPDWLIRAAAAVAWCSRSAELQTRVNDLIDHRYTRVPPELEAPAHQSTYQTLKKANPRDETRLMYLGFAIIAVFMIASVFGIRWLYLRLHQNLWYGLGGTVGVVFLVLMLRWEMVWLIRVFNINRKPRLVIEPSPEGGIQVTYLRLPAPRNPWWLWWLPLSTRIVSQTPEEYRKMRLPDIQLTQYRNIAPQLAGFLYDQQTEIASLPLELSVAPALESYPWEALLAPFVAPRRSWQSLMRGDPPGTPRDLFQFWRTGNYQILERTLPTWNYPSVILVCRPTLRRDFEPPWKDAGLRVFASSRNPSASQADDPRRVLHLIGRLRRSGLSSEQSGNALQIGGIDDDAFVQAADLPLVDSYLVIVQCLPADTLRRTDSDRQHNAEMRLFCRELFDAGAPSVLFLPTMPFETARNATNLMARICKKSSPPGKWKLLDMVSALRKLIAMSVAAEAVAPTEAGRQYWTGEGSSSSSAALDDADILIAKQEIAMDVTIWTRTNR